ncbi:MAG: hypothetical protein HY941_03830 [Gammaproteobacteria bacterium]|nr:hypothetical protein [Gammaproteobacteria bacterium]
MNRTTPVQQRFGRSALNIAITAALSASALLVAVDAQAQAPKYLLAWMSDQMLDGNNHSPLDGVLGLPAGTLPDADFVAVIDADPTSPTYGKVVNTAEMPAIYGQHLLSVTEDFVDDALDLALANASPQSLPGNPNGVADDDILGGVPNFNPANGLPSVVPAPSSVLNEAHHHSVRPYVNPTTGRIQAYYGGLISANVFGCDITDPLHITPAPGSTAETDTANGGLNLHGGSNTNVCGLSVSGAVNNTVTGTDDLEYNPTNGHYYTTMMGAGGSFSATGTTALSLPPVLTTPGGLQEFDPSTDAVIGDYSGVPTAPVYGHGTYANGSTMIGPKRYAPRVQVAFGGVDGNGNCSSATIMTAVGANAWNLCTPGVSPHNQIGADSGAVNLSAGINEGPDTGLLAHPHGIGLRSDLNGQIANANGTVIGTTHGIIMTSDYADPVSLALTGSGSGPASSKQNLGTTIRLWDLSNPAAGPYQVIQMPDGNRHEDNAIHEEPEGLMAMRMTHSHTGAFVASMCGGSIYYSPDITIAKPDFKLVYDFGACTGTSVFTITQDDGVMFVPISGIQTTGDPIKDRDYAGEHNRRVAVLDIRGLLAAGTSHGCDMPPASAWNNTGATSPLGQPVTLGTAGVTYTNAGDRFNGTVYHPNNGNNNCPKLVDDVDFSGAGEDRILATADDHPDNETSRGGPHFTVHDENDKYVATSNYFVDLREFAIKDVDLLLSALGLGHAWNNGSGGAIPNAYPPGGPNPGDFPPGGLGGVHAALGIPGGQGNALPGTGSVGDDTICMMKWDRNRINLKLDTSFNAGDANSPRGCVDMDFGDTGASWPAAGTRVAAAGNATPHGMSFITVGSTSFFTNGEIGGSGGHHSGGNTGHH